MADDVTPPPAGSDGGEGGGDGSDPLVGSTLAGRYRILRRIGVGAMGAVYLAEHLKIGRKDAIKVLRPSLVRDQEAIARFARGARNASRIHHPNVCTVYDFAEAEEDFWFLALEYVDGEELSDLLEREGPLPVERAVALTIQIARALGAAHRLGIVHRDLKPGNVMVGRGDHGGDVAKVVDFDIAKGSAEGQAADLTRMGFTIGTPEYMSPEQLMVDGLDGRSDLYSLGLVLFRMLTGRLPFRGTTANDLMLERLNREPLTLAEVSERSFPAGLQPLLDRALQRRPEDRPADAVAFMTELEAAVAEDPVRRESAAPAPPAPGGAGAGPTATAASSADPPAAEVPRTRVERGVPAASDEPRRIPWWVQWAPVGVGVLAALLVAAGWALLVPRGVPEDERVAGGSPAVEAPGTDARGGEDGGPAGASGTGSPDDPDGLAGAGGDGSAEGGADGGDTGPPTGGSAGGPGGGSTGGAGGGGAVEPVSDPDATATGGADAAASGGGGPGDAATPSSGGDAPGPAAVAQRLDELSEAFLEDRIPAEDLRRGAAELYRTPGLPDSLQARVAYGVFVGATALGDEAEACRWIRRAADHAPDNDRYRSLARGCGG
jgi:serine/threonine-protein kinase